MRSSRSSKVEEPMRRPIAFVPAKSLAAAKGRLASVLSPPGRAALAERMLAHVLGVLAQAGIEERVVVSGDPALARLAGRHGAAAFDPGTDQDLNAAATAAVGFARSKQVLLIAADLPWLSAEDVGAVLAATAPVVIGEAKDGGTNALLLSADVHLTFAFATASASAQRHAVLASEAGHAVEHIRRWGLAQDIDTPADLERLCAEHPAYRDFLHAA